MSKPPPTNHREPQAAHESLALERIVFFSDGVIAIALTLLVIGLAIPTIADATDATFVQLLKDLAPRYLAFLFSFAVVALYWLAHHRMFRYIVHWNGGLLRINLLFLFFVVQIPLLSSILGSYGSLATATALYAFGLLLMGLSSSALWIYAYRNGLLRADVDPHVVRFFAYRSLAAPAVFALSIPIAFFSVLVAQITWLVVSVATNFFHSPRGTADQG
jgi:TMEM175 potassium channel family protein